jgi:hypothetical protein
MGYFGGQVHALFWKQLLRQDNNDAPPMLWAHIDRCAMEGVVHLVLIVKTH